MKKTLPFRRVLVLANPRSGLRWGFSAVRSALDRSWDVAGTELTYQFSQSAEDGVEKACALCVIQWYVVVVCFAEFTLVPKGQFLC